MLVYQRVSHHFEIEQKSSSMGPWFIHMPGRRTPRGRPRHGFGRLRSAQGACSAAGVAEAGSWGLGCGHQVASDLNSSLIWDITYIYNCNYIYVNTYWCMRVHIHIHVYLLVDWFIIIYIYIYYMSCCKWYSNVNIIDSRWIISPLFHWDYKKWIIC